MKARNKVGTVISKDGTRIAYDKTGQGPALIIVAGAFQDRMAMSAYAGPLLKYFTVYNYDRFMKHLDEKIEPDGFRVSTMRT